MRENNRNDKRNFERRDGKKRDFKGKRDYRDRDRKQEVQQADEEFTGGMVEGRNAVIEAFRSGKTVDKLFVLASSQDGPIRTIIREAKKHDTIINYVEKERLDELSTTGKHQGVIAQVASYSYATVEDILARAEEKGEPPFILLLDGIEDPHNLGAIIRTANLAGAHGVIVPKHRAVGLTATVAKTSAGALNYTPVAKVTNLVQTMEMLKEKGILFGLEFLGPKKLRKGVKHEFIHDLDGMLKLCDAIGTGNCGILMDAWHWDMAEQKFEDFDKFTSPDMIVCAHIMDAPANIPADEQDDIVRRLPGTTGIINIEAFFAGLKKVGYEGPVLVEPFEAFLSMIPLEESLKIVAQSFDRVWPR